MQVRVALLAALLAAAPSLAQTIDDPGLALTPILTAGALNQPTSMAFVAPNDFLVLEKATGRVRRVLGGVLQGTIALDLPVNSTSERGLLGIAVNTETPRKVFLYVTEAATDGGTAIANRVYRYTWNGTTGLLGSPQLILDLPVTPGPNHDGGVLVMGTPSDGGSAGDGAFLYVVIGELNRNGQLQNNAFGAVPDDTGVIFRIQQDGSPAAGNPFSPYCSGSTTMACDQDSDCGVFGPCLMEVASYFGYGVRNSFGMTRDPLTGALWMTENGPESYDEINRVPPGWNSGWNQIMGPDSRDPQGVGNLWNVPDAGSTYKDPEFSWFTTIAPTGIALPFGSSLGAYYDKRVIVGDANLGQLYAFPLNGSRTAFNLTSFVGVSDLVADNATERNQFRIGSGFGSITDLEVGPDANLYIVSLTQGNVYRLQGPGPGVTPVPALPVAGLVLLGVLLGGVAMIALRRMPAAPRPA